LLVERVIVLGEDVTIEHVVPLSGRFCRLRPDDRRVGLREVWRQASGAGVPDGLCIMPLLLHTYLSLPVVT